MSAGMAALLLDLDGVIVLEMALPTAGREILRLHAVPLAEILGGLAVPVIVLTHRSRAEAHRILAAAGLPDEAVAVLVAAEDLFRAGLRHGGAIGLLRRGLRKSWILPVLEQRIGITRQRIAFVDDRQENLDDLLQAGIGLALHAPCAIAADGTMVSFSLQEMIGHFADWREGRVTTQLISLTPVTVVPGHWQRSGSDTRRASLHLFNLARHFGRRARFWLGQAGKVAP